MTKGAQSWKQVSPKTISTLKTRSATRVKFEPKFKEIITENKKVAAEKNKPLVLGESFSDRKDRNDEYEKKRNMSDKEKLAEYLKRPDLLEAVNILTDYIDLDKNVSLKLAGNKVPASVAPKKIAPMKKAQ